MSTTPADTANRITLSVDDGRFEAHVAAPPGPARASLVLLHEIFGITDKIRRYAADYAAAGIRVIAPDLFWRQEPGVELGHDGPDMKRAMSRLKVFDEAGAMRDIAACVQWLREQQAGAPVAVLGFCLGGKLAVKARQQGLADGYVGYYGIGVEHLPGSLDADAPLMMHFGTDDSYAPVDVINAFTPRLGAKAAVHLYDGVGHAFYRPGRDAASDLSRTRTLDFLGTLARRPA